MDHKDIIRATVRQVGDWYTDSLGKHGSSAQAVGWRDRKTQWLRFEKLAQVIEPAIDHPLTFNDWGCGYGAMFTYLDQLTNIQMSKFYGYDISDEMLLLARRNIPDMRAEFIKGTEVTTEADYSFVSGTFNVRFQATDEIWLEYIKDTLLSLAKASRRGIAFNLLTIYVDWKDPILFYADPFVLFDFCKRNIGRYVTLLHDYELYEWTIYVRK